MYVSQYYHRMILTSVQNGDERISPLSFLFSQNKQLSVLSLLFGGNRNMYLETFSKSSISSIKTRAPRWLGRRLYDRKHDNSLPDHDCSNYSRPHKVNLSRKALVLYLDLLNASK
jgi:hypothetical protein